ncbi:isoflavone 2'-hydroxylase-like [Neltuma alba]|uniref:isoflavone 2'-hydroxylase-like n=1 Tax=Neltuma alba TaxID=207710 RepID=UPI0010A4EBE7|nr:isoflavone 2'-hydroxylase-like [Prosopis alba]
MVMELPQWFVPASCVFILICISTLILRRDGKRKSLPPGPPGLPVIGHLHLMKPPIHRTLQKLSEKYGPVMFLRFGSLKVLVVSSPSAVEECFTKNDIVFANRPATLAGKHLNYDYKTVGFAPYGDHWRGLRRLINQELFSVSRLSMLSDVRMDEVLLLVKQLFGKSGRSWMKVELRHRFVDLIFDVTLRMISGKRYYGTDVVSKEATDFKNMMGEIFELLNPAVDDLFPILRRLDLFGVQRRMKRVMKKQDSFLQNLLDEHRRKRSSSSNIGANQEKKTMTLIEVMLSLQKTDPVFYSDTNIKGIAAAVVAAGTETSASTMEWALAVLLNHPEVMEKLKTEIDTHVGKERFMNESDIPKLTYLQNVVLETLRIYPAGALGVPHMNSEDSTISGYHVPKGTMLMVNLWVLHKDPKHWKDATKFMPERFENGQGSEGYNLIPFGAGRRQCPGANLAKRIMALTIGLLVQVFEWKRIGDQEINMMEGDGLTLPRLEPLVALIRPRQEMLPLLSSL